MNLNYTKDFQKPQKAFLLTKFLAYSQFAFASFLINVYFWRITEDVSFLVLFNIIFYLFHALTYIPAGKVCKEWNRFIPLRIGAILQIVYLVAILIAKERITEFVIPIAIIGGIAHGAYWSSDNLLKFDLTSPDNRFKFLAVGETLKNVAGLFMPLIASIIVIIDGGVFSSYSRVFLLAIFFSILVLVSSLFISSNKKFKSDQYDLWRVSKKLLGNKNIRIACFVNMFRYIADCLTVLLGLLLYFSSGTELSLGGYQFVTVLIVILAAYLSGSIVKRKNYRPLLIYGGLIEFLLIFILFISQSYVAIFVYGILSSLITFTSYPLYPLTLDALNMCSKDQKECVNIRVEYITLQELFVGAGYIIGFLILLLVHYSMSPIIIGITAVILALTSLLARIYITKIKDNKFVAIDGMN